ncbi:MAG: Aminopeptidase N [Chlamydiae bacterium]|nr:Aminopeptidase N [Chlamydiota bacterium]
MHSRAVHRIENVSILRTHQFAEDAGPTAHPIRPSSYIEMNNFYTTTVYDKGSEIIRMVYTLLGKGNFFNGMKKYFELYDGKSITCDDFINAMEIASNKDLSQFKLWYEQKGTPQLEVSFEYDSKEKTFTLNTKQSNPKEGENAAPLHFPLQIGLIAPNGTEYKTPEVVEIREKEQSFTFKNIEEKPVASLNRDFSAPINLKSPLNSDDYLFLMKYDSNDFNRWESSQEIAMQIMLSSINTNARGNLNPKYVEAFGALLTDSSLDSAFKALALNIPSESLMGQKQKIIQFNDNHSAREWIKKELAIAHEKQFLETYNALNEQTHYSVEAKDIGNRKLKNSCLSYLAHTKNPKYNSLFMKQFTNATNMTDKFAALSILNLIDCPERTDAMSQFYDQWHDNVLVITKWLSLQAICPLEGALERMESILNDPVFDYKIPNIVRAVMGSFFENHTHFHALDGSGYRLAEEQISKIDEINPSTAARLSTAFRKYPKLDKKRQEMLKASLEKLLQKEGLSRNAYEIINKSLNAT